jgi:hypothetical protein
MQLYALVSDGGDGSNSIQWFADYARAKSFIEYDEEYSTNDDIEVLVLPDGFDLSTLGISIDMSKEVLTGSPDDEDEEEDD